MKFSLLTILLIFCVSCGNGMLQHKKAKLETIQGAGEMHEKWKQSVLNKCKLESAILTIQIYEGKPLMGSNQVNSLNRKLMWGCSHFHGITM